MGIEECCADAYVRLRIVRSPRGTQMEQKRRIVPPVYLVLTLASMGALHRWAPIARLIEPPYSYLGALLIMAGIVIAAHSAFAFTKAGTPVIPFERSTALVTNGFYRVTRNPMYLGMVLVLLGTAVVLGTASPLIPIPVFILIIQTRFIAGEERFLQELFGEQYLTYKSRVRRWL
jgi:protein-S-isoprenylcysteine O-methyltransferase Ste14